MLASAYEETVRRLALAAESPMVLISGRLAAERVLARRPGR
jgi:hypothetical protein